jgi:hypothetical protein
MKHTIAPKKLCPLFEEQYHIHINVYVQRHFQILPSKTINSSLPITNSRPVLMSLDPNQKDMGRKQCPAETKVFIEKTIPGKETEKRVQKEWRRLLEEYYVVLLTNDKVPPIAYLLRTCQRNHQMRRTFIRKWKKLEIEDLLQANRCLEDPDVKYRFDKMFPLSAMYYPPSPQEVQQRVPTPMSF